MTAPQEKMEKIVGSVSMDYLRGLGGYDLVKGLIRNSWCIGLKS